MGEQFVWRMWGLGALFIGDISLLSSRYIKLLTYALRSCKTCSIVCLVFSLENWFTHSNFAIHLIGGLDRKFCDNVCLGDINTKSNFKRSRLFLQCNVKYNIIFDKSKELPSPKKFTAIEMMFITKPQEILYCIPSTETSLTSEKRS